MRDMGQRCDIKERGQERSVGEEAGRWAVGGHGAGHAGHGAGHATRGAGHAGHGAGDAGHGQTGKSQILDGIGGCCWRWARNGNQRAKFLDSQDVRVRW